MDCIEIVNRFQQKNITYAIKHYTNITLNMAMKKVKDLKSQKLREREFLKSAMINVCIVVSN